ncbi:MAG: dockerin type I domain-containing protein, partial [Pirellulales bacterium]
DGDWLGNATVFIDNVRLVQKTQPPLLTLEINTTSGLGTIKNVSGADAGTGDVIFDYYEIRSTNAAQPADFNGNGTVDAADYTAWRDNLGLMDTATQADGDANGDGDVTAADYTAWKAAFGQLAGGNGTSLNPAGWNSLDDQNVDPTGVAVTDNWAEGAPSSTSLSEARLIGSSTWNDAESRSIGNIYTPGAAHNLTFRYREPSRPNFLQTGFVTYVGAGAGGASAVPEPGTLVLALVAGLFAATLRRT